MFKQITAALINQKKLDKETQIAAFDFLYQQSAWHILNDLGILHDNFENLPAQIRLIYGIITQNPQIGEYLYLQQGMENKIAISEFLLNQNLTDDFMRVVCQSNNLDYIAYCFSLPIYQDFTMNRQDIFLLRQEAQESFLTFASHWRANHQDGFWGSLIFVCQQAHSALQKLSHELLWESYNFHFAWRQSGNYFDAWRFAVPANFNDMPEYPKFLYNKFSNQDKAPNRALPCFYSFIGDESAADFQINWQGFSQNIANILAKLREFKAEFLGSEQFNITDSKIFVIHPQNKLFCDYCQQMLKDNSLMFFGENCLETHNHDAWAIINAISHGDNSTPADDLMRALWRYAQTRLAEVILAQKLGKIAVFYGITDWLLGFIWRLSDNVQFIEIQSESPQNNFISQKYAQPNHNIELYSHGFCDKSAQNGVWQMDYGFNNLNKQQQIYEKLSHIHDAKKINMPDFCAMHEIPHNTIKKYNIIHHYLPLDDEYKNFLDTKTFK